MPRNHPPRGTAPSPDPNRTLLTDRWANGGPVRSQDVNPPSIAKIVDPRIAFLLMLLMSSLGCGLSDVFSGGGGGGGGGNGGGSPAEAALAVDPIDLPPGQTVAPLGWPASDGPVDSYLVFESRNGAVYTFTQTVSTPSANISGQAGDSVQVTVVAVSPTGEMSDTSPPSPPINFHAAAATTAVHAAAPSAAGPASTESDALDLADANAADTMPDGGDATEERDSNASDDGDDTEDAERENEPLLTRAVRSLLLAGDARLPASGLSEAASDWLAARVDEEVGAGVVLAGTGRDDDDPLRELVWQDPAGQLFVSDGREFLDRQDLPSTFREALRLNATERFVDLADFDGDGAGDWLIEDTTTGEIWLIDGATEQNLAAVAPSSDTADAPESNRATQLAARLAGAGDFDADGRPELLWRDPNGLLDLRRPSGGEPMLGQSATPPEGFELLAIADLDGDGRDDLLGRDGTGALVQAFSRGVASDAIDDVQPEPDRIELEWRDGTGAPTLDLDLVATVDIDEDGTAEIAWLNGATLEIWKPESGLDRSFDF